LIFRRRGIVDYDREADVLYISFARPQQATDTDMTDERLPVLRVSAYEHCHAFGSSSFSNYPLIFRRGVKARRKRFAPG
jgi:hypothetical protein